jgi:hypothetical protein
MDPIRAAEERRRRGLAPSGLTAARAISSQTVLSVDFQEDPVVVFPVLGQRTPNLIVNPDGLDALYGDRRLDRRSGFYGAECVDQVIDNAAVFEGLLFVSAEQIQLVHHASPILYSCTVLGTHGVALVRASVAIQVPEWAKVKGLRLGFYRPLCGNLVAPQCNKTESCGQSTKYNYGLKA